MLKYITVLFDCRTLESGSRSFLKARISFESAKRQFQGRQPWPFLKNPLPNPQKTASNRLLAALGFTMTSMQEAASLPPAC
jgi:hypothetical protein